MIQLFTTTPDLPPAFAAMFARARETTEDVGGSVTALVADVRARGDAALLDYAARLARVGPAPVTLAEAGGLQAHARSVALRLGQ